MVDIDKVNEQLLDHNGRTFMGTIIQIHVYVYFKNHTIDSGELKVEFIDLCNAINYYYNGEEQL